MGKLPPSLRSTQIQTNLFRRPQNSSSVTHQNPKPYIPKSLAIPSKTKPDKISINQSKAEPPNSSPIPCIFTSPSLSSAISSLKSISHMDPNLIIQSFIATHASVKDTHSFFAHVCTHSPSFALSRSTFNSILTHSLLSSDSLDLKPLLGFMSEHGFQPDKSALDVGVRALCTASRIDDAVIFLCNFPVQPDEYTYNFLIKQLAKTRPISSVHEVIETLKCKIQPNMITYTILIECVCRSKNLREATRLLHVLKDCGFKPDCYLYNTIMKGYCTLDHCGEVMAVYNKMKDEGVEPDLITYNTLVYGLSKAGMVDQARKFLGVMASMGHFPDTVTYTSLMNGMCRKGDALGAVALLGEMEEKGCSPNDCTYNTLLMGLCKTKCLEKGVELYEVMKKDNMKLEASAYASFVRVLCRAGKVAEAYETFDYVLESKSLTEASAYLALESALKGMNRGQA